MLHHRSALSTRLKPLGSQYINTITVHIVAGKAIMLKSVKTKEKALYELQLHP